MGSSPDPVGTLDVALNHAVKLLDESPALAIEQAEEILKAAPRHPLAVLLKGAACRKLGDLPGALDILRTLAEEQPGWAPAQYELGVTLGEAGLGEEAVDALYRAVRLKTDIGDAWRLLGDHLTAMGDAARADAAYANHIKVSTRDPRLLAPAIALCENRIPAAEALLRDHLKKCPTDVAAIRMLAEVAARLGRFADAQTLLERCLELAPGFNAARHNYAVVLQRRGNAKEALVQVERLLQTDRRNPGLRSLNAAVLGRLGRVDEANTLYGAVLADYSRQPKLWMSYGHSLKTAGRLVDSIAAYRKSIELAPNLGEAYWSLANLKTFRFTTDDVAAMRTQLCREDLSLEDRWHFHFALGKALEDAQDFGGSFEHYAEGNRLRRTVQHYDAKNTTTLVERSKALFTPDFFSVRHGVGCAAPDPIFIVGLPRAGSTLVEQILSSHSAVEGTMELPDVVGIVGQLSGRTRRSDASAYPDVLASLSPEELRALGARYLEQTRIQRRTSAPYFIDKLPNNWAHAGLIHLMLPHAKIIDARRHPLSCCFSGFKQHFARGQAFTYSLDDLGRYYRDYVDLMAHFDRVLPGRIHRVIYERMVEDTEGEVRRLLDYCGLPFEPRCLRFYENERAVRTPSSEQVRQPIYRQGVDQWRHYDNWLGPLRQVLGSIVDHYPDVPAH
ncbi:MAG TPA: sulfotransferase [Steroidobacteraceae bacterium]|nr:sulfotransferase [Steroidobacteraceae bacterium]